MKHWFVLYLLVPGHVKWKHHTDIHHLETNGLKSEYIGPLEEETVDSNQEFVVLL